MYRNLYWYGLLPKMKPKEKHIMLDPPKKKLICFMSWCTAKPENTVIIT